MLGVEVSCDEKEYLVNNYNRVTEQAKAVLLSWRRRSLSLYGKISVINTLVAPLFNYLMYVLPPIPDTFVTSLEKEFVHFIWNGHKPKIPLDTLKLPKELGGLGLVNLRLKDEVLKLSWVKTNKWPHILITLLTLVLIICGYVIYHILILMYCVTRKKMSYFWCSVLKTWCMFNFSADQNYNHKIWYNSLIRIVDKPFYLSKAASNGLNHVSNLYRNGQTISSEEACKEFGLSIMQFNAILSANTKGKQRNLYLISQVGHP